MTSATTIVWIEEMGYYKKWLLPKLDILKGKIYHSLIPGNSPELIPLENSLNNDYNQCSIRHVAVTLDCLWAKNDKDTLINSPELYLDEIRQTVEFKTGKRWSKSSICRRIRSLGISLQVVYERARQIDISQRASFKLVLYNFVNYPDQLVFVDETSKSEHSATRRKFWNIIGRDQPFFTAFFGSHNKRYTVITAGDINGFIPETIDVVHREHGRVREKLCPTLGRCVLSEPRSIVVIDNATIHHTKVIVDLIAATDAKTIYTAPYSPDLNPIEFYFGMYKRSLMRNFALNWLDAHFLGIYSVTPAHAKAFFRHCGVPGMEDVVKEQDNLRKIFPIVEVSYNLFCVYPLVVVIYIFNF